MLPSGMEAAAKFFCCAPLPVLFALFLIALLPLSLRANVCGFPAVLLSVGLLPEAPFLIMSAYVFSPFGLLLSVGRFVWLSCCLLRSRAAGHECCLLLSSLLKLLSG